MECTGWGPNRMMLGFAVSGVTASRDLVIHIFFLQAEAI
jgi:hypothetical protein